MTELTLVQLIGVMRRWWWLLVIGPLVGGVLGWTAAQCVEPVYQADAKLLIDRSSLGSSQTGSASAYNDILAAERLTQTFGQLVTTRVVLSEALARMGEQAGDLTVSELEDALTVTIVPDTQIITVEVTDADPERAALIVNTVGEVFTEEALTFRPEVSVDNSEALQQSIDDVVEQMNITQDEIAALEARPDANTASIQAQLRELRTLLGEDQTRHAELVEIQQRMTLSAAESGVLVKIVDPAVASDTAVNGNPAFTLFIGLLGGFVVAGGVVFVLGYLDNTVKRPADVTRIAGRNALGIIPAFDHPENFDALTDLRSAPAEAFRALRTNLQFATARNVVRSIVVTSATPGDGKTTSIIYLAMVLAQGGQRVILVDGNLRKPALHRLAGVENRSGFSSLMLGESMANVDVHLRATDLPNLRILPSGPLPPNPADLLNSQRTEDLIRHLELKADIVLIDSPALGYADALILTGMTSGSLLVIDAGKTRSNELSEALSTLAQAGRPIFGTILNNAQVTRGERESQPHLTSPDDAYDAEPVAPSRRRRKMPSFLSR
jgi:non-specific protein-tyrosine kinase